MKRIITCSDGTWNKPEDKDRGVPVKTNVAKMFNNICAIGKDLRTQADVKQLKAYDTGVGTGYSLIDKITGGVTGAGIDKNIKDMYSFICMNYVKEDEIYLFGFSRGAYTARSLAGFIRNCGLLRPENIHLVNQAYNLYRDRNEYSLPDSDMMQSWRAQYCVEDVTSIMFIGIWDTVGALGIPLPFLSTLNYNKYKFHDCKLSSFVNHAYHALALHEKRSLFEPTLWEISDTVKDDPNHIQKMEQRWFAGVHSNIGGGYSDSGLSDLTLEWIANKAADVGLCFHDPYKDITHANYNGEIRNSITPAYWLTNTSPRKIDLKNPLSKQCIDESVLKRYAEMPSAIPSFLKPYLK